MKNMKLFKIPFLILMTVFFLSACAGTDIPWSPFQDDSGPVGGGKPSQGGNPPPSDPGDANSCLVKFSTTVQMNTISKGAGSTEVVGIPRPIPPAAPLKVQLHFKGSEVWINGNGRDFAPAILTVGDLGKEQMIRLRMKSGTKASGTYESDTGKIEIKNAQFILDVMENETTVQISGDDNPGLKIPPLTLTTEPVTATAAGGNSIKAPDPSAPKNPDNVTRLGKNGLKLLLVAGIRLDDKFLSSDLKEAGVTIRLNGAVDQVPDLTQCASGGNGGGDSDIILQEIVDGNPVDLPTNNTLDFGRVFVPETMKDTVVDTDTRFVRKKILRISNNGTQDVTTTINSTNEFKITPNGNVTIPKSGKVDLNVVFQVAPVASSPQPPQTRPATASIVVSGLTVNLVGVVKTAAPELTVIDTNDKIVSTTDPVDLGIISTFVDSQNILVCRNVPTAIKKIYFKNTGTRDVTKFAINVKDDVTPPPGDCGAIGQWEFFGSLTDRPEGGAVCPGRDLSNCTIPADSTGKAKVGVTVSYFPHDASPIKNSAKDTGVMNVTYQEGTPLNMKLAANMAPDRSDSLRVRRADLDFEIQSNGNVRFNIKPGDPFKEADLLLLNYSDKKLERVSIDTVEPDPMMPKFSFPMGKPTSIPARTVGTGAPGQATLKVRFTSTVDVPAKLIITFTEEGAPPEAKSIFIVNLIGSINHVPLTGYVKFDIDFITAEIDHEKVGVLNSVNLRKAKKMGDALYNFRSGPFLLKFEKVPGKDYLRKVTVGQPKVFQPLFSGKVPTSNELMATLRGLSQPERATLIRLYSTKFSTFRNPMGEEFPGGTEVPDCDPGLTKMINGPYQSGDCSFFYFLIIADPNIPGIYNDETGMLTFPKLSFPTMLPYHQNPGGYGETLILNTLLKGTLTSETISSVSIENKYQPTIPDPTIPLVSDPLGSADLALEDSKANPILADPKNKCPDGWSPWLDIIPQFGCYMNSTSPHYFKGYPVTSLGDEKYSAVLSLLVQFSNNQGSSDYVPWFMAGRRMFAAFQGNLIKCSDLGAGDDKGWWPDELDPMNPVNPCNKVP